MKLQSLKLSKNIIESLLESKVHIGLKNYFVKEDLYFYLYGFRNKVCIFNLTHTYEFLQKLLYIFITTLQNDKKIVFVFSPIFLKKHWLFLTLISKRKYVFLADNREKNDFYLAKNCNKIGFIFLFHYIDNDYVVNFAKLAKIPLTGFTSNTIEYFDYPIVGNFQSFKSTLYFYRLLVYILKLVLRVKKKNPKKKIIKYNRKTSTTTRLNFKKLKDKNYKFGGKLNRKFKPFPDYKGYDIIKTKEGFKAISIWDSKDKVLRTFYNTKYELKPDSISIWDEYVNKWYTYSIKEFKPKTSILKLNYKINKNFKPRPNYKGYHLIKTKDGSEVISVWDIKMRVAKTFLVDKYVVKENVIEIINKSDNKLYIFSIKKKPSSIKTTKKDNLNSDNKVDKTLKNSNPVIIKNNENIKKNLVEKKTTKTKFFKKFDQPTFNKKK